MLGIPEKYKIVIYQGALSAGRGVDYLLDEFKTVSDSEYVIVFMGYGGLEEKIKKQAENSMHIYFMPAVSPGEVLDYTASADVGVTLIEDICLSYRYCLPNKLFEYIMAGIPVIVSDLPEMKRLVNECKIGEVGDAGSGKTLFSSIEKIESVSATELGKNLSSMAAKFNWSVQESKMIHAYKKYIFGSLK